jgi:hypothetical protein
MRVPRAGIQEGGCTNPGLPLRRLLFPGRQSGGGPASSVAPDGFEIHRDLLIGGDIERLERALEGALGARSRAGARGGAISIRPLLVHASSKSRTDRRRRVIHIEYALSLDVGDGLSLATV